MFNELSSTCFDNKPVTQINEWYNKGTDYQSKDTDMDDEKALDCFKKFIILTNPEHEKYDDVWYNIGVVQQRQENCEEAINSFNQHISTRQNDNFLEGATENLKQMNNSGNYAGSLSFPTSPIGHEANVVSSQINLT